MSTLFFVISGVLFWASDYFADVVQAPKSTITTWFALTALTAPILGALMSQSVFNYIGSYDPIKALPVTFVITLTAQLCGACMPFANCFAWCIILMWLVLFFGGILLPLFTGIMLSTVEAELRPKANSIANLCYNLFGWLPAPFMYGTIC